MCLFFNKSTANIIERNYHMEVNIVHPNKSLLDKEKWNHVKATYCAN